jgi:hypothetical protein
MRVVALLHETRRSGAEVNRGAGPAGVRLVSAAARPTATDEAMEVSET